MLNQPRPTHFLDPLRSESVCDCTRRTFIKLAVVAGAGLPLHVAAASESEADNARLQAGDRLVFAEPDHEGVEITPTGLSVGSPQVQA